MLATIGVGYIIVKTQTFFPIHSKIFVDFTHCEMLSVTEINNLIKTDKVPVHFTAYILEENTDE